MTKPDIKIGIIGLGTVGGGTVELLHKNAAEIQRRIGCKLKLKGLATRTPTKVQLQHIDIPITHDNFALINDPEIDIIVELIGGCDVAKTVVLAAIANGKHVVTANKALIAQHGNAILAAAAQRGVTVAFEAAVAGGIPILKVLREGLAANQINWLAGIINGTTNFILSQMQQRGQDFFQVLEEAQRLGYAEADPSFDIDGIDAAHKLTILASMAFGIPLQFAKVYTEGISKITPADIQFTNELGYRIKHLALAKREAAGITLRVHAALVPKDNLLANINGVLNAVQIHGNPVGSTLYCGAGAGAAPTASAVVADIIEIARQLNSHAATSPALAFQADAVATTPVLPIESIYSANYLRLSAIDKPGVMSDITHILGKAGISIEAILQKEPTTQNTAVPIVILTNSVQEAQLNAIIPKIEQLTSITAPVLRIRVVHPGSE